MYRSSQTARQSLQAVRPRTADACPQTTHKPTAWRASRRRLAASLSRLAVSGWQSAQRRRPGAGGALPHSMQSERSPWRRWRSVRARWAWRRASRQSSQLVLPSSGLLFPQRRHRPAWRRSSRRRCLRARLAARSFSRQASQRRGAGFRDGGLAVAAEAEIVQQEAALAFRLAGTGAAALEAAGAVFRALRYGHIAGMTAATCGLGGRMRVGKGKSRCAGHGQRLQS